ncbi:MAG: ABC transporter ATP-binding protein [Deltaproteobacteria bacterium]|jgi:iron complex transport system ATP-binding protein|nr:ABC transporter ATP-binding protein [Deltaproteobacteria bacterium]
MIELEKISFAYQKNHKILDEISFYVNGGEIVGLLGPNGSGKTTILKLILSLLSPTSGTIKIDGQDCQSFSNLERAKKVAYVPQDFSNSFPISVFESVLMGRRPYINWGPRRADVLKTVEVLDLLSMTEFSERPVNFLSGGQKQKVVLARALAQDTPFLLLDEPIGNLDLRHQVEVLTLLKTISHERNIGILIAMHDINMAIRYTSKILLLSRNKYIYGNSNEILNAEILYDIYGINMEQYQSARCPEGAIWFPNHADISCNHFKKTILSH